MSRFLYQTHAAHRDGTRDRPAWRTAKTTSSHYGLLNSTGYILVWGFWHKSTGKRPSSRKHLSPLNGKPKLTVLQRYPSCPQPLGLAPRTRRTPQRRLRPPEDPAGSSACCVHPACCRGDRAGWQERVTRRGGALWKQAWMLQSFSPLASFAFPQLGAGCQPILISLLGMDPHSSV